MKTNEIAKSIIDCFKKGNKLLICGNGGSAAMAQHMAAELVGKYEYERKALPAIALTTDTSILTALSNDYKNGFDFIFARQVQALGKEGDILILLSTSGKSQNCLNAWRIAIQLGIQTIDFPRKGKSTAKIQEYQLRLMHSIVRKVEKAFI